MRPCHECGKPFVCHHGMRRCEPCRRAYFAVMEQAHRAVSRAIRNGELPSLLTTETACVDCGRRAQQYDHRDYTKPLAVEPVCRKCNYKRGPAAPLPRTSASTPPCEASA